jgi:hypothetical protein
MIHINENINTILYDLLIVLPRKRKLAMTVKVRSSKKNSMHILTSQCE